ncbi:hypothetical protein PMI42_03285 [Bradyrhizobium sp. YR681]|uniref:hypothetical protein n=1 Tax=Bradyrhizobium sp. YR681 TaxID=1144344 RepID=UPI0002714122|nr:hypothetical protein [Bradyrhizobium sp. YR681]EJN13429.1 hypothetical protein PMI42_03285 [Bradyrhizobium sp. YR681]
MAAFLNNCRFIPAAGGTTDWVYASTVGGCQSPALAGAIDGRKYKFLAISSDLTQWEIAEGTYTAASGSFARATALYNSSGSGSAAGQSGAGAKINFTVAPNVAIVGVKEDLISVEEPNAFTSTQMAQARANLGMTKKNYLVNGGMQISQENGTGAGSSNLYYPVDQWYIQHTLSGGAYSCAQVASPTPGGSTHRIRVTVTAAQTTVGGSVCFLQQKIEGFRVADLRFGTASAKTVTLQLGLKAPVAGTFSCLLQNNATDTTLSGSFTVAAGEVNTDVVKSVTFVGATSGTWAQDNTNGMYVYVYLMQSTGANIFSTSGNVFELFDAGLYEGGAAPPFQCPDYAGELLVCQRYYQLVPWGIEAYASGGNQRFQSTIGFAPKRTSAWTVQRKVAPGVSTNIRANDPASFVQLGGFSAGIAHASMSSESAAAGLMQAYTVIDAINARL